MAQGHYVICWEARPTDNITSGDLANSLNWWWKTGYKLFQIVPAGEDHLLVIFERVSSTPVIEPVPALNNYVSADELARVFGGA